MNIGYIYPQWLTAKRELIEALDLNYKQGQILDDWLRAHVFEFGVDHHTSQDLIELANDNERIMEMVEHKCIYRLVEAVINKGCYMHEVTYKEKQRIRNDRFSVLIFASPIATGPEERTP